MDVVKPLAEDSAGSGWQGMTIKEILEKVDLFNVSTLMEEDLDTVKDKKDNVQMDTKAAIKSFQEKKLVAADPNNPESAFLGPKIWKNPISLPMLSGAGGNNDAEFSVMNIDDFLSENNFDINRISPPLPDEEILGFGKEIGSQRLGSPMSDDSMDTSNPPSWPKPKNQLPKGENAFLYAESKRAKLERERAERKRKMQVQVEFSQEELALATIPGADFDPKRRHFSAEELRPQPIIRKRKKTYVNDEEKDNKYWERREKNNVAARRSREARRLKENQIALRTAYLEKENAALQAALDKSNDENLRLAEENKKLTEALERFQRSYSPDMN